MENHRERGFTFISMFYALSILAITLALISPFLKAIYNNDNYDLLSVQQFFNIFHDHIIHSNDYKVYDDHVDLTIKKNITITFEQYGFIVRRLKNHTGHEIYLRNIQAIHFSEIPYGIHVKILTKEDHTYEKDFTFYP